MINKILKRFSIFCHQIISSSSSTTTTTTTTTTTFAI
jgi:hypothetical protein